MTRADITEGVVSTILYLEWDKKGHALLFFGVSMGFTFFIFIVEHARTKTQQKMASTGGGGGEQQQQQQQKQQQTPQHKQTVLDLGKYIDKGVRVKLSGGREVEGILKGFDQLLNLVLDETKEYLRDVDDPLRITDETRKLGLIVTRGTSVMVVSPLDGLKEIENPFAAAEEY